MNRGIVNGGKYAAIEVTWLDSGYVKGLPVRDLVCHATTAEFEMDKNFYFVNSLANVGVDSGALNA